MMIQRPTFTRIAIVTVVVGAAVWGLVRFRAGAGDNRADGASRPLAALVAAVGARRAVEPRLSGGFAYGAVPSALRSAVVRVDDNPPDVRIAIAEIEKLVMRERSPATLRLLGLAHLSVGDAPKAVAALEEAAAAPAPSAVVTSDLAAAYLVRGLAPDDAQDLPKALAAAHLALKADPSLAEAQFNLALALERLHLTAESRTAWQRYLQLDGTSAWSSEARAHLLVDAPQNGSDDDFRRVIESVADNRSEASGISVQGNAVQRAREWVEDQLLSAWPDSVASGNTPAANVIVTRASRVAAAAFAATGDRFLLDMADAVRRASASRTNATDLARAHAAFRRATAQYENNAFAESGRSFADARPSLERSGSPLAFSARLQVAISAYYASDVAEAARELDALIPTVAQRRYLRLLGLLHRMRGLTEFVRARYGESLEHNTLALKSFAAAADPEDIAAIESSLAENLEFLGESREAWVHREQALAGLDSVRSLRRRHTILISSVLSCLRQGSTEAAGYFQAAVLANATRWNRPEALAEAHVRQAELHGQMGESTLVASDLAEARRWVTMVPASPLRRQIEARMQLASASFMSRRGVRRLDEQALTDALDYLRQEGLNWALAKAYLARGKAYVELGRPEFAERDFLNGIEEFEKQRASLTADAMRASYFDQPWDLFSEMVRLQTVTRHRPDLALSYAERGRARTLFEAVSGSERAVPLDVSALQRRLPSGVALVYYSVLEYEVVIWRLTHTRLDSFESSVSAADLERLINRLRAEIDASTTRPPDSAAQLYDVLARAAVRDLPAQTTVVFVPDGVLHALPFGALLDRGTGRYLIQDFAIALAPSASVFVAASGVERDHPSGRGRTVMVMGNPRTASASAPLPDLPDADREAKEIAALYAGTDAITGEEATKRRFLEEFDRHDVVHFAGHAISNSDFPALSRLVFAGADGGSLDSLFAHEIAGRHFRRAEVLVLAACQTSGGRIRRGEGVLSLARPFLAAGVPTVVASLWDADDRATRTLLVSFHAALREGEPPAAAMRRAQLAALASADVNREAPSKWAGFVVIGSTGISDARSTAAVAHRGGGN